MSTSNQYNPIASWHNKVFKRDSFILGNEWIWSSRNDKRVYYFITLPIPINVLSFSMWSLEDCLKPIVGSHKNTVSSFDEVYIPHKNRRRLEFRLNHTRNVASKFNQILSILRNLSLHFQHFSNLCVYEKMKGGNSEHFAAFEHIHNILKFYTN